MNQKHDVFWKDWDFHLVEPEGEVTTLGKEKLRLEAEMRELEADITRQLAGLPRWIRWIIKKRWPSIFRDL